MVPSSQIRYVSTADGKQIDIYFTVHKIRRTHTTMAGGAQEPEQSARRPSTTNDRFNTRVSPTTTQHHTTVNMAVPDPLVAAGKFNLNLLLTIYFTHHTTPHHTHK